MRYFLSKDAVLKRLETPCVYHLKKDELYELDDESFEFLKNCAADGGYNAEDSEFIGYCIDEGILTGDEVSANRPPVLKSPAPSLRYLELQITDKCNLRCKHCYIGDKTDITLPFLPSHQWRGNTGVISHQAREGCKNTLIKKGKRINKSPLPLRERVRVRGNELSVKQIRNVLMEFEEMQGLRVLITGGEPLLHTKFEEINDMLPDFSIRKVLFSNGLLLIKETFKALNFDEIQISIDGLEDAHDTVRGKGTFRITLETIKNALDYGIEVSVATMIHPKNLNDFDEMERLFRNMGIKDWTVDIPCATGRLEKSAEFQISPQEGGKYLQYGFGSGLHTTESGYACGLHLMAVMSNGRAAKCTFYSESAVGNIQDGLRTCWQRIKPVKLSELNCDCEYKETCRGGCRYRAELYGGIKGKDLYRCALYDVLKGTISFTSHSQESL